MIIHPEEHLKRVGAYLRDCHVLEVGCGDGYRSQQLASFCESLVGIDPDEERIAEAKSLHSAENVRYEVGTVLDLPYADATFGAAVFVLSLHHIPADQMARAIDEALRVTRAEAPIIFIEPGFCGSFFEADSRFLCVDGDERPGKAAAYAAMLAYSGLREVAEFWDETRYTFDSTCDFLQTFEPDRGTEEEIHEFLEEHGHRLTGARRVNVFHRA